MRLTFLALLLMSEIGFSQIYQPKFDVQGHRGCRGIRPENSIPAFITALDSGVTTLEMDLAVSADGQLVVSHEPWMSAEISLTPEGKEITQKEEKKFNLYQMAYADIARWDCGSKINPRFPEQLKIRVSKPLLHDVIVAAENHIKNFTRYEVDYNIEIKTSKEEDNVFHPAPEVFSDMVFNFLNQYLPQERVVIQSFDFRVLRYFHEKYPQVRLAALVANTKSAEANLKELGFTPAIYSPEFRMLNRENVAYVHSLTYSPPNSKPVRVRVIPWTVNEEKDMLALKGMGVDGFITDYPNRAKKYKLTLNIQRP